MAFADTDAAKDAIATIEESGTHIENHAPDAKKPDINDSQDAEIQDQKTDTESVRISEKAVPNEYGRTDATGSRNAYDSLANLPMEFYHYYHGSNTDMGTLIEVR